jgi:hypothetical protein
MQWKPIEKTLRTAGASLSAVSCSALVQAADTLTPAAASPLHDSVGAWPWVAVAAIVGLLAVIALAARRRLPFGKKG